MRERSLAAKQALERGMPDRERGDVVGRDHVGRARRVLDQRELTEEVAGVELERPTGLADDERVTVEDHVERLARLAEVDDRGARAEELHAADLRDAPQLLRR